MKKIVKPILVIALILWYIILIPTGWFLHIICNILLFLIVIPIELVTLPIALFVWYKLNRDIIFKFTVNLLDFKYRIEKRFLLNIF